MKHIAVIAAVIAVLGIAGCSTAPKAAPAVPKPVVAGKTSTPMVGVFEPGVPLSYAPVEKFAKAVGTQPHIALWYGGWGDPFRTAFAAEAARHGAIPFVQINPGTTTMAQVATGDGDSYLKLYANQVRSYGKPVIIGFAAEPNGTWDQWGRGHTAPVQWVAAWRHVVTLFRAQGAQNVIWLWTVNSANVAEGADLDNWWPGAAYVTWVGIDGYYYRPSDTFQSVFGTTASQVRQFTNKPILISEVAVGPTAGPGKISTLFVGVMADKMLGLVWFDQTQNAGVYHQDWRLEDTPTALTAFRTAVEKYGE